MFNPTHQVELLILPEQADVVKAHVPDAKMRRHGNTTAVTIGCRQMPVDGKIVGWVIDPRFQQLADRHKVHIMHSSEPQALAEAV